MHTQTESACNAYTNRKCMHTQTESACIHKQRVHAMHTQTESACIHKQRVHAMHTQTESACIHKQRVHAYTNRECMHTQTESACIHKQRVHAIHKQRVHAYTNRECMHCNFFCPVMELTTASYNPSNAKWNLQQPSVSNVAMLQMCDSDSKFSGREAAEFSIKFCLLASTADSGKYGVLFVKICEVNGGYAYMTSQV